MRQSAPTLHQPESGRRRQGWADRVAQAATPQVVASCETCARISDGGARAVEGVHSLHEDECDVLAVGLRIDDQVEGWTICLERADDDVVRWLGRGGHRTAGLGGGPGHVLGLMRLQGSHVLESRVPSRLIAVARSSRSTVAVSQASTPSQSVLLGGVAPPRSARWKKRPPLW